MHSLCFLSLSLVILVAGQVPAQAGPVPNDKSAQSAAVQSPRKRAFEFLDKDKNGLLIRDEFLGGTLGKAAKAKLDEFKKLDADESGALDFQEFQKLKPLRATPERLAKEFARLDKDADGKLTLKELLAGRSRQNQPQARRNFVRFDADRDGGLTVEEFQRRGRGVKLTAAQEFKIRDEDGDGKLSEDEFVRPSVGKPWEKGVRRNFTRFDLDHDGALSPSEFAILPTQKSDATTLFKGLDTDRDQRISRRDLQLVTPPAQVGSAQRLFDESDGNRDGSLDESEYQSYSEALSWASWKSRFWTACVHWLFWGAVTLDVVLVAYIVWCVTVIRKAKSGIRAGMRSDAADRESVQPDVTPTAGSASSELPPMTPESLDEFHVE